MRAATEQELEERIKVLHAELDAVINEYVDARAAACVGVPRGSVEASIIHRAGGCKCREYTIIQKRITDEEELARRQQEDALPEG
jgi:hypothetical protein